jgi:hypothetical protein
VTAPRPTKPVRFLVGAFAIITALSTSGAFGSKDSDPSQTLQAARVAQAAPVSSAAASPVAAPATLGREASPADRPSAAPPRPAPPARVQSLPVAPPARPQEAVGRPNPFAPIVVVPPPSRPLAGGAPSFGLDLPLPPGFAAPGAPGAPPPPPPGPGLKVGAIVGGSTRVAVIDEGAKIFVVGVGDRVDDAVVVSILKDKVVMRKGGTTFDLPFGGEGS